ncbi:MAG: cytochrome c-type biogenesis protein CcmH [Bauldia sp.]|nr:cytochrome c-type biogenesis protein CcmH [Bauldia sp.]MCW5716956.1 cytochrome c-type biogenesis protein CcmH [Bauldia sp.]
MALASLPALAVQPDEMLADPVLEARARALSAELRCLVCQNQSIDASDSQFARDIRIVLRERLTAGDTDSEALDFLVARYGQYILLKPEFNATTALLWIAPPLLLVGGGVLAFVVIRRRSLRNGEPDALTPEEQRRLDKVLRESGTGGA